MVKWIYKAGKISFLLVCLFLCTACYGGKTVFEAGAVPEKMVKEETPKVLLININTASAEELMSLPGIGEVRAAAIIAYRQQNGEFETIEDIMKVKGIKTGIFSKINNLICVK